MSFDFIEKNERVSTQPGVLKKANSIEHVYQAESPARESLKNHYTTQLERNEMQQKEDYNIIKHKVLNMINELFNNELVITPYS